MSGANEKDQLDRLTMDLKTIAGHLYDLELLASDYPVDANESLMQETLTRLVQDYQALDASKDRVTVSVPQDVLEYIEAGRNPNVYTRQFSEAVTKESQNIHGKMIAHKDFASQLANLIKDDYPELIRDVERIESSIVKVEI